MDSKNLFVSAGNICKRAGQRILICSRLGHDTVPYVGYALGALVGVGMSVMWSRHSPLPHHLLH